MGGDGGILGGGGSRGGGGGGSGNEGGGGGGSLCLSSWLAACEPSKLLSQQLEPGSGSE